jgi:proteasome lid subunit RPN8/RPN11
MELPTKTDRSFKKILNFLKDYSNHYFNIESCGFVGINKKNQYVAQIVANRSSEPMHYFVIDPLDYLNFIEDNNILFVFHSHPQTDSSFSETDQTNCEAMCVPFLLYSVHSDKFSIYIPQNHKTDVNILNKVQGII